MSEQKKEQAKPGDDKSVANRRRKKSRRMYDQLAGKATDDERQAYDKLLWSRFHNADRRSGAERRDPDEDE